MMDKQEFIELADKVAEGIADERELSLYNSYINHFKVEPNWNTQLMGDEADTKVQLIEMIHSAISVKIIPFYKKTVFRYLTAASIAIALTSVCIIFYYNNHSKPLISENQVTYDAAPGGNKALLTLANGSQILLNDAVNGKVAEEQGIHIMKTKEGELIYQVKNQTIVADSEKATTPSYNTVSTPRGGQYQVLLPDGTRVWLNASSSVKFPTYFAANNRTVDLVGEAYFEVSKDSKRAFIVNVDEMKVEVLGTHFNIMAYRDEQSINTTLLEGAVKVIKNEKSRILSPGQQAVVNDDIQVIKGSDDVIAWKNGLTSFKDADISTIMRQVARWYDVEVKYEGKIPSRVFTGEISRKANLSELIKIIELSDIKLKLEGNVITVMNQ